MKSAAVRYRVLNLKRMKLGQMSVDKPRWIQEGTRDIPVTLAAVGTVAAIAVAGALLLK